MRGFNPGRFNRRIEFLSPPVTKNDYGELTGEWELYKSVMASKEPILGKELFAALTNDTRIEVKFRARYTRGVTDVMRIRQGNEVYEIISVIDVDDMHKELLCYCKLVD